MNPDPDSADRARLSGWACLAGAVGLGATLIGGWWLRSVQWNVVRYEGVFTGPPVYVGATAFATVLLGVLCVTAWLAASPRARWERGCHALALLGPLALNLTLLMVSALRSPPPFAASVVWTAAMSWSAWRVGRMLPPPVASASTHRLALAGLLVWILVATAVHTHLQLAFFDHFMLGHADLGHYAEELKNVLTGRGLRSDSFPNTRLGWHFSPSLYVLAPLYGLCPSPTMLMIASALCLHLGALPVYFIARRLSGSPVAAFLCAVAWLLHPSVSRMVYSDTYGFQWVYVAIPLTLGAFGAMWESHWVRFSLLVGGILLVQETTAAAVLGIGCAMLCIAPMRRKGIVVCLISLVWALLCVGWIIPHFAASGQYERITLFGSLGGTVSELVSAPWRMPTEFFGRLTRPEGTYFLIVLLGAVAFLPLRRWRVAIAALPSLFLVLLMENPHWLSIKFWHQATALPVFFLAAIHALRPSTEVYPSLHAPNASNELRARHHEQRSIALAFAVATACAWSHYLYGFSPLSKSFEVFAADASFAKPDPRLDAVRRVRTAIPRDRTILTTERMAAHFTDYARLYTGKRVRETDCVLIDRSDEWDQTGLPARADEFARNTNYKLFLESGPVVVFVRTPEAPPIVPEE